MSGRFNTDTYMRQEFDKILREYGHNVYLQRRKHDDTYEEELEVHTVRFSVGRFGSLGYLKVEAPEGILNTSQRIYYFRYNAQPFENDRIYEIEPRPQGNQSVWVIDAVVPMYGVGGNLVYWAAGVTRIEPS